MVALFTILSLLIRIIVLATQSLWLASAAGFVAMSPDFVGLYNYLAYEKSDKSPGSFIKLLHVEFHRKIQRYERPWGIWVEMVTFITFCWLLSRYV